MTTKQKVSKHTTHTNLYKLYKFGYFDDTCIIIKEYDIHNLSMIDVLNDIVNVLNTTYNFVHTINDISLNWLQHLNVESFWSQESFQQFQQVKDKIVCSFEICSFDEYDLFFVTHEKVPVDHSSSDLMYI